MRHTIFSITALAVFAIGVTTWNARALAAEAQSSTGSTDPRIVAWMNRAIQTGRKASAACDADLTKAGMQELLAASLLSSDPDFSKEILITNNAIDVVKNNCDTYAEDAWKEVMQDFHLLGLSAAEEGSILPGIEAGYRNGGTEARDHLTGYLEDVRDFLQFLQSSGAKWQGPGKGYLYPTDADALKAKDLESRVMTARKALLEAPNPATLAVR